MRIKTCLSTRASSSLADSKSFPHVAEAGAWSSSFQVPKNEEKSGSKS
jgi:hypothetical protein